ncbi:hypothetical protein CY35_03G015300 [Sphagnum magellanicum]|nr:hypothetical protein CY35_03G015300 [Sphagnum magellanicum]
MVNSVSVVSITVRVSANAYCGKAHLLLLLLLLHQLLISLSSLSTSEIRGCCELASARWLRRRIHSVSPSLGTCMMTGMQFKMPRHSNFWSYETNHKPMSDANGVRLCAARSCTIHRRFWRGEC